MIFAIRSACRTWLVAAAFLVAAGLLFSASAHANDAEVVLVIGTAHYRETDAGEWKPLQLRQMLPIGAWVRTAEASQVALVLKGQTQVRVNERSEMKLRAIDPQQETTLDLVRGRAWAQVKGVFQLATGLLTPSRRVRVNTPSATIGIRGTDWDVEVGEDRRTLVTVLSGEAELSNPFGQVALGPNEQGTAEFGKAPVKRFLSDARDRVQWVTAYRPAPRRWVRTVPAPLEPAIKAIEAGDYASAFRTVRALVPASREATLVLADLHLFQGRAAEAIALLAPLSQAGDPMAAALHGRALALAGRLDEAQALLTAAAARNPGEVEVALALADVARLQGNADESLRLFADVTRTQPANAEGWFGAGRIQSEKEEVRAARRALDEAIRLAPDGAGYYGERATLEVFAGDYAAARAAFDEALRRQPDDYVAWTGLGILQLKTGRTAQALESFLKAGVLEPRFARAQLYVGVAYYQLGNSARALEAVKRATELDPKDPLPWVMMGLMHGDALELRASTDAMREAQVRMPNLKSLNQLANNQKGSANVGSALAAQGMEEWARAYAFESYNPFWAGSALFLSDRYPDSFNKNSELYRGYLLDPTVFGASNRWSSLVPTPGAYGSIGYLGERKDFTQHVTQAKANGLTATGVPIAYSLTGEYAGGHDSRPGQDTFQAHGANLTFGIGARPTHALGLFYFGTATDVDGHFSNPAVLPDARLGVDVLRHDGGASYRFGPRNQLWFKVGDGTQRTRLAGSQVDTANAVALSIPGVLATGANARLDRNDVNVGQEDVQLRHTFEPLARLRLTWGVESSRDELSLDRAQTFSATMAPCARLSPPVALIPPGCVPVPRLFSNVERDLKSSGAYVSGLFAVNERLDLQLDLNYQRTRTDGLIVEDAEIEDRRPAGAPPILVRGIARTETRERDSFDELNPRLGIRFSPAAGQHLRAAYQRWRRPFGTGSLGLTETAGIPIEDRLVDSGGLLRRTKVRYDWEADRRLFMQFSADRREVDNLQSRAADYFRQFGLTELAALRARRPVFDEAFDELEKTPVFGNGRVSSAGAAVNWLATSRMTVAARYLYSTSRNTGAAFAGREVPLTPRHFANAALFYQIAGRWLAGASATYRSQRFRDEANAEELTAGWIFGARLYWESDDKRWSIEAAANNLHSDKNSAVERRSALSLTSIYRF